MYVGLRIVTHRRSPMEIDNPGSTPRFDGTDIRNSEVPAPGTAVGVGVEELESVEVKITVGPFQKVGGLVGSSFFSVSLECTSSSSIGNQLGSSSDFLTFYSGSSKREISFVSSVTFYGL